LRRVAVAEPDLERADAVHVFELVTERDFDTEAVAVGERDMERVAVFASVIAGKLGFVRVAVAVAL
jgi:hypothetical protein